MIREVLSNFPWPFLTCIALLIFFSLFCAIVLWTRRKKGKIHYSYMESLPLQEESRHEI